MKTFIVEEQSTGTNAFQTRIGTGQKDVAICWKDWQGVIHDVLPTTELLIRFRSISSWTT